MAKVLPFFIGELQVDHSRFLRRDYLRLVSVARDPELYLKLVPALGALKVPFGPIPVKLLTNDLGVDLAFGALL